jgi:hypothetical protein
MAMAKIYPIGVQSFAKLREEGYTYVDKTSFIERLITRGNCYFLSRPRRFGKSLLLSTIEAFYQGRKDLFEGLAISRGDYDWQPHPVLHIALNAWEYDSPESLLQKFSYDFGRWEKLYGTERQTAPHSERFRYIIEQAYAVTGQKVVILIDEYDKPLLDTAGNKTLQDTYRSQLKSVYCNLKNCDRYIEFAMLTGVSRFGKLSIFSDLNNLQDISLSEEYSAICGMTIEEIRDNFDAGVHELADRNEMSVDEAYEQLKKNYDGYHFSPTSPDMYNPFSLLSALSSGYIRAYWFSTGTPSFLVEMIRRMQIDLRDLEHTKIKLDNLMDASFDLSNAIPLMYQSGYLTIRSHNRRFGTVQLDYPNEEVEQGFLDMLMKIYTQSRSNHSEFDVSEFVLDVEEGRVDDFVTRLQALFSGYQYDQIDLGNLELHYRNVIYLAMKLMGFYTHAEMRTAAGRIDLLVSTPDYLYLFEFKINKSAQAAMDQINDRDYLLPFQADGRKIVKVGVNFDDTIRSISEWIVEFE